MHVRADLSACQGYVNCAIEAPAVFDVDDEGKVVVLQTTPPEELRPAVQAAVRACPARALGVDEG